MRSRTLFLALSLALASIASAQTDLVIVQEPENPVEGDLVTLTVRFPEGYAGEFDPIFEERFYNFPLVEMVEVPPAEEGGDASIVPKVVGTGCSFSAGCRGARDIPVRLGSFRLVGKTIVPKTIRHVVKVQAMQGPAPPVPPVEPLPPTPPAPPNDPPTNLPEDPGTPVGANAFQFPAEFVETPEVDSQAERDEAMIDVLERIRDGLAKIDDRLDELQQAKATVAVAAPALASGASLPAKPAPKPAAPAQDPAAIAYANRKPGETWVTAICGVPISPYKVGSGPISTPGPVVAAPMRIGAGTPALPTGGRWNIEGNWNPTRAETMAHLRESKHVSFSTQYEPLERFSHGQLRWIHDQHEDALAGRGMAVYTQPSRAIPAASACPGGVCPTGFSNATGGGWYPGKLLGRR